MASPAEDMLSEEDVEVEAEEAISPEDAQFAKEVNQILNTNGMSAAIVHLQRALLDSPSDAARQEVCCRLVRYTNRSRETAQHVSVLVDLLLSYGSSHYNFSDHVSSLPRSDLVMYNAFKANVDSVTRSNKNKSDIKTAQHTVISIWRDKFLSLAVRSAWFDNTYNFWRSVRKVARQIADWDVARSKLNYVLFQRHQAANDWSRAAQKGIAKDVIAPCWEAISKPDVPRLEDTDLISRYGLVFDELGMLNLGCHEQILEINSNIALAGSTAQILNDLHATLPPPNATAVSDQLIGTHTDTSVEAVPTMSMQPFGSITRTQTRSASSTSVEQEAQSSTQPPASLSTALESSTQSHGHLASNACAQADAQPSTPLQALDPAAIASQTHTPSRHSGSLRRSHSSSVSETTPITEDTQLNTPSQAPVSSHTSSTTRSHSPSGSKRPFENDARSDTDSEEENFTTQRKSISPSGFRTHTPTQASGSSPRSNIRSASKTSVEDDAQSNSDLEQEHVINRRSKLQAKHPTAPGKVSSVDGRSKQASSNRPGKRVSRSPSAASTTQTKKRRTERVELTSDDESEDSDTPSQERAYCEQVEAYLHHAGSQSRLEYELKDAAAQVVLEKAHRRIGEWLKDSTSRRSGVNSRLREQFELASNLVSPQTGPNLATEWSPSTSNTAWSEADTLREEADVWVLDAVEATQLVDSNLTIDKPVVIRADESSGFRVDWFLKQLCNERGPDTPIFVQGGGGNGGFKPHIRPIHQVVKDVQQKMNIARASEFEPINCLDIATLPSYGCDPAFMTHPRFSLVDVAQKRVQQNHSQAGGKATKEPPLGAAGKQSWSQDPIPRPIDIESSRSFQLLASEYTVSDWHKDILNCTWVQCLSGCKAWYIVLPAADGRKTNDLDMTRDIRLILLRPGDILFMPAGVSMRHAVVTLEGPCTMIGGQRLDGRALIRQLQGMGRIMMNAGSTNESVPCVQLPGLLDEIIAYIDEGADPEVTDLTTTDELRGLRDEFRSKLACSCHDEHDEFFCEEGLCACMEGPCPCHKAGRRCTAWCQWHEGWGRCQAEKDDDEEAESESE